MAGDQKQFETLLETLMNPENDTRTKTEVNLGHNILLLQLQIN